MATVSVALCIAEMVLVISRGTDALAMKLFLLPGRGFLGNTSVCVCVWYRIPYVYNTYMYMYDIYVWVGRGSVLEYY